MEALPPMLMPPSSWRVLLLLLGMNYSNIDMGILRYAKEVGWDLEFCYSRRKQIPLWWDGDGILALIANPEDWQALSRMPPCPVVDLSALWLTNPGFPAVARQQGRAMARVLTDQAAIGEMAANHFIERRFRQVVFFNHDDCLDNRERLPAFATRVRAAGGTCHVLDYHGQFPDFPNRTREQVGRAFNWLKTQLAALPRPFGMFVQEDNLACHLLATCRQIGLRVPEEAAVLGCLNDAVICELNPVPLSSVDCDQVRQGYEAARLLDLLMTGHPVPARPLYIPPKGVVTRQSTHMLAVPHPVAAAALHFVWERFRDPIGVTEVAQAVGVSRSALERAFLTHVGRSVAKEILRCRLEAAKEALAETRLKAWQVAAQCGFGSQVNLSVAFLRETGLRPTQYRQRYAASR